MDKNRYRNISFKIRLFLSVGTVFLLVALIVCFLFSGISIKNAIETDSASSDIIVERVSTQIDSLYEQMNIAATSITKNPTLKSIILKLNTSAEGARAQYTEQMQQERTIQTALGNMMFSPIISNVLLYNRNQNYFYYSGSYFEDMDYVYEKLAFDVSAELFRSRPAVFCAPRQSQWTPEDRTVLSVLRNFSDAATTQDTIVEIQIPFQLLRDICSQDSFGDEKEILILDEDGSIVYPLDRDITVLPGSSIDSLQADIASGNMSHYSFSYSYSALKGDNTDFTAVLISNNRTVHRQIAAYIFTTLLAAIFTLGFTLFITYSLITRVTRPMNQLIGHVNDLTLDHDTKLTLPADTFDEFEILNTSLNQMVTKLKASIQEIYELQIREGNANLAALQAQVDPHFLYNALNSISAASEIYDSEITTKMCQDLSSMMRYVTSKKKEVTLIEEITHTKNYLEFMKISNGSNFDYTLKLSGDMYGLLVPKLSVQPFAENSFRHGFKNTLPPWRLSIVCLTDCDNWEIQIADNGGGFTREALDSISTSPVEASELEVNGLGLNNTFSRLSLYFGESFSYHIENISPGCCITLKGEL